MLLTNYSENESFATCLSPVYETSLTHDSSGKVTLNIPSSSTHLLIIPTTNTARVYIAYIIVPGSGNVYHKEILDQGVTIDATVANKLSLTWSGTPTDATMYDIVLRGNKIT